MENGFSHVLVILSQDGISALGGLPSEPRTEEQAFGLVIYTKVFIMFSLEGCV